MDWAERTYRFSFVVLFDLQRFGGGMDDSIAVSRAARGLSTYRAVGSWCVSFAWIALLGFVAYAIANLPW